MRKSIPAVFLACAVLVGTSPDGMAQDQAPADVAKPVERNIVLAGARYKINELLERALLAEYPSAQVRREGMAVIASTMTFATGQTEIGLVLEPKFVEGSGPSASEAYGVKIVVRSRGMFNGVHLRAMQAQLDKTAAAQSEVRVVTDDQARITNLDRASGEARERSEACYKAIPNDARLDPLRAKVALGPVEDQTFAMLASLERPQDAEKAAILVWGTSREQCDRAMLAAVQRFTRPEIYVVRESSQMALRNLIVALYRGELTYGDFAKLRQDNANLSRSALANVDRELRKESEESRARAQVIANQSQQILIDAAAVDALNRTADAAESNARRAALPQPAVSVAQPGLVTTNCRRSGSQIICQSF
jgi:hypothetical protein